MWSEWEFKAKMGYMSLVKRFGEGNSLLLFWRRGCATLFLIFHCLMKGWHNFGQHCLMKEWHCPQFGLTLAQWKRGFDQSGNCKIDRLVEWWRYCQNVDNESRDPIDNPDPSSSNYLRFPLMFTLNILESSGSTLRSTSLDAIVCRIRIGACPRWRRQSPCHCIPTLFVDTMRNIDSTHGFLPKTTNHIPTGGCCAWCPSLAQCLWCHVELLLLQLWELQYQCESKNSRINLGMV